MNIGWFHRYPARFAAEAVKEMLTGVQARLGRTPSRVLDPFMGTGTTLAASRQLEIESVGTELFRLGALIAKLRLDPPDDLEMAVARADLLSRLPPRASGDVSPKLTAWMGEENARRVAGYVDAVDFESDGRLKRFLVLAISAALRPSSKWLTGSIKAQIDPGRTPLDVSVQLRRAARLIAKDCAVEANNRHVPAVPMLASATTLPLSHCMVDVLVTSPPYWTTYDYVSTQRLTYWAFRWPAPVEQQIGRQYGISPDGAGFSVPSALASWYSMYGAEHANMGRALREYTQRMRRHLREAFRVLVPGGIASYAIANSTRSATRFDLVGAFCELAEEAGFEDIETIPRSITTRRILPAGRDRTTGRFSSKSTPGIDERIVYMCRPLASSQRSI
jgi:hypothetical protein